MTQMRVSGYIQEAMQLYLTRQHALDTPRDGFRGFSLWAAKPTFDLSPRDASDLVHGSQAIGWTLHRGDFDMSMSGNVQVHKRMDADPLLAAQRDAAWALMWSQLPDEVFVEGKGWQYRVLWDLQRAEPHEHSRFCVEIEVSPAFWIAAMQAMSTDTEIAAWSQGRCELPF